MTGHIGLTAIAVGSLATAILPGAYPTGTPRQTRPPAAPTPDLAPSLSSEDAARLMRHDDGFFYADARINGRPIRLLVDTGASALILPAGEARRLGVDTHKLTYDGGIQTSAGRMPMARATIGRLTVGGRTFEDVPAMILPRGDSVGLMGQAVLARFRSVSIEGDMLALR